MLKVLIKVTEIIGFL